MLITHADDTDAGVKRSSASVCLSVRRESVCLSLCPRHNPITNDPKVFKLGTKNALGISYKYYDFGVERSKVKVTKVKGDRVTGVSYVLY